MLQVTQVENDEVLANVGEYDMYCISYNSKKTSLNMEDVGDISVDELVTAIADSDSYCFVIVESSDTSEDEEDSSDTDTDEEEDSDSE